MHFFLIDEWVFLLYDLSRRTTMTKFKYWYVEALVLALLWLLASELGTTLIAVTSYADLLSVAVLIVFIQFLFQAKPPVGTANYLRLSYVALFLTAFAVVAGVSSWIIVVLSGYVFSLSIVYVMRQIKGT
jgi:hypothetical protein